MEEENWENDVLYLGRHLIAARITPSGEYQIQPKTKSISSYAFQGCRSLTSITIPESVTDTFAGCKELRNVIVCGQKEREMLESALLCAALGEKEMEHLITRIKKSGRYAQENFYETYEGSVQPMYRFAGKDKHGIHSGNLQAYSDDIG